ncbi:hypothetical protein [Leptolyngbya sp. BL0902]|uniref:hypothetical protein n=1 Tax=Leptolyngbya sp. BL0902 TaxID=1115757 RepID=UPI0018E79108|nr:hypothetical protein [Leptolyngbya sp. BL0902]
MPKYVSCQRGWCEEVRKFTLTYEAHRDSDEAMAWEGASQTGPHRAENRAGEAWPALAPC